MGIVICLNRRRNSVSKLSDIANELSFMVSCMCQLEEILALPNCNDCGKAKECEKRPNCGETVRFNCPLWEAEVVDK